MRHWGYVITAFYALIVMGLLVPGAYILSGHLSWSALESFYSEWMVWLVMAMLVGGQALLLFLSVDTTKRRFTPRTHVAVSIATSALLVALLSFAAFWTLASGIVGDEMDKESIFRWIDSRGEVLAWWAGLWAFWSVIFFIYFRKMAKPLDVMLSILLKGSVLELLVAVPCHILVRHRDDCSAPIVTGFGIATGVAIMLISFGPGVLFLYKKRLDEYGKR